MVLSFAVVAQSPSQPVALSPSETELIEAFDLSNEEADPQAQELISPPSAWRSLGSLIFVLGIAGGGIWALRKWGIKRLPGSGGNRMKVEETLALGERRFVSILKVDEERFLIASYPQGICFLARLEPGFESELDQQIQLQTPIPVRDMEARLKREQP